MVAPGLGPWLLALSLAAGPAAVTAQVALEQHMRELAVREGDGVTFQCSMSGGRMSNYYIFWYWQGPRGTLDWIFREGDAYGEGFQGRFKGTVESSQNRFTLQIQAAKQGDEAVYYCGASLTLEQLCSIVDQKLSDRDFSAFHSSSH
ncbi:T cell receptor alpha chain MC.7.G5 [Grus japonensis]